MQFTKSFALVLALFMSFSANLHGQNKAADNPKQNAPIASILSLSLEQAIEMAIKESEDVKIKQNEIQRNEYRYDGALASVYPHLKGEILYDYNPAVPKVEIAIDPSLPPEKFSTLSTYDFNAGITLDQVIYNFGRVSSAIKAADNTRKISTLDKEAKKREVSYSTAVAYLVLLLSQKSMEIAKDSYDNAKLTKLLLEQRYSMGRIPKRDNIKSEADVASRIPGLKSAESNMDLAKRSLKTLLGLSEEQDIALTDSMISIFPRYELSEAQAQMKEVEPTLKLLEKKIALSGNIAVLQKSFYYPSIDGFARYSLWGQSEKAYIGAGNIMNVATLGLKISIPIWNGGETSSIYHQAIVDKMNAELDLQKAKKGYDLELKNSISKYNSLLETYKANEDAVKLGERSYNFSRDRFQSGEVTLMDINDEELRLTSLKLQQILTQYSINETIARIEKLISQEGEKSWKKRSQ
jgi:outer membrane protein